ncbi:DUF4159 domain-containing protein [Microcoleus sp. FACHB-831]|uniref:DUF4159 domain-containing protein n=1 Tax=Microcoleus sp. FACHB-831 TaxID=2692827 RepID=UPI001682163F|nr:DUF4159 domain-containing protein [Microcoleus sp. FACHB-831]MBD1924665.1 DUF4159 domain-containing protein [Microcoleus sp. FACHB-831]
MNQPFPPPPIRSFERLQVQDGLLMTADRWRRAHEYHRQRQSVHYQSLNQPGIVCGLGVTLISAPNEVPAAYRDGRWLQIQPGIAIDLAGNPIVIPQPENYRLSIDPAKEETVYVVVSYVDPEKLRRKETSEIIKETFRIDEKNSPPSDLEVEVCRILLRPGAVQLEAPKDVLFPDYNNIDLRYRNQARSRPQTVINFGFVKHSEPAKPQSFSNVSYLLDSVAALYPALAAEKAVELNLKTLERAEKSNYDIIYLTGRRSLSINEQQFHVLKSYLDQGSVLLVDAPRDGTALVESIATLAQHLGTPLEYWERLSRNHPLRTQPFLFAALPTINEQPIQLLVGGGIVLLIGDLSSGWGLDEKLSLSRTTIRTAQELGINILNFASRRRQMTQLLKADIPEQAPAKPTGSKSVFDKLL